MKKAIDRYPLFLLSIIGVGLYGLHLGALEVSIMEARNFIVAREMLTEGHWLLTTMNDVARYEKPPLPAWLTTPFLYLFGIDEVWAYRIPTSLFALLGLLYVYKLARVFSSQHMAFYAALVLGTSFYYLAIRIEGPSDIYAHVTMIMGLYYLFKDHPHLSINNSLLGGVCMGLSILAKGPVGLYALMLPFVIAYYTTYQVDWRTHLTKWPWFIVVGLLLGGSWYVFVRYADAETFIDIASSEADNWAHYNVRPFYYYWSFFIQSGIWTLPAALSLLYPYFAQRVTDRRCYLFSFVWTLSAVLLLSIIPEKKPRYLVPVLVPLALNTMVVIDYLAAHHRDRLSRMFYFVQYPLLIVACIALVVCPLALGLDIAAMWPSYVLMILGSVATAGFTLFHLIKQDFKPLIWSNIFIVLLITAIAQGQVHLLQKNDAYFSISHLSDQAGDGQVFHFWYMPPELLFSSGRIIPDIRDQDDVEGAYHVLVGLNDLACFQEEYPAIAVQGYKAQFDENYFRAGDKRRKRFIYLLFEVDE